MTGETLNIKIRLDTSEATAGAKKLKTQLTSMAGQVKKSIPQISSESKNAAKSLNSVTKASSDAKKAIGRIGDEAKSLSDVAKQSEKVASSLKSIRSTGGSIKLSMDTGGMTEGAGEAESSLESMRGTMTGILGLQFWDVLSEPIKDFVKGIKSSISGIAGFGSTIKDSLDKAMAKISVSKDVIRAMKSNIKDVNKNIKDMAKNMGVSVKELKTKLSSGINHVKDGIKRYRKEIVKANKEIVASFKPVIAEVGKVGAAIGKLALKLAAVSSALFAVAGVMIANGTKEYREEQAKLVSAFQSAGASAKEATQAYRGIFRFLGDSASAVEAANHLAKLTTNTKELAEWTTICQGVYATFGDSLRVEGLTEAANETARTGVVTGVLADALNWAGVQETAFNERLAQTTSLSEREALIRKTLNGLYSDAAALYERNNQAAIAQNEAQARLSATMGKIGQTTQVLVTSLTNLANTALTVLAPAISYVSAVFSVLIDKLSQAIQWIGSLLGISFAVDTVSGIVSGAGAGLDSVAGSAGTLTDNLEAATGAAEKLKKTTMGFDELNIVTNPNTSSGGGSSTDIGGGGTTSIPALNTGTGILGQIGEQTDKIKAKIEEFFEKWKTQIAIIAGALGALGIAGLLEHLGRAIGLGDKFLATMKTIKKLAATVITIVLQYTLVNEFMDNFIQGGGLKEYIKGLIVSALGTWVLYSMWGTGGLIIGLGVTAVASLKAVFDNGGITNAESALVAFTGIASAITAIGIAAKKVMPFVKDLVAALKGTTTVAQSAAFVKISGEITKIGTAVKGISAVFKGVVTAVAGFGKSIGAALSGAVSAVGSFAGTIGSALGLTGGAAIAAGCAIIVAAIAAVAGAITFLVKNWKEFTQAIKDFWNENIVPKFESMGESFRGIGEAVMGMVDAFVNLGKTIWNALPEGLQEWLAGVWQGIKDVVAAIGEWFKSIDWLKAIGDAFEFVGMIVIDILGGAVMGAIQGVIGAIDGVVKVVEGAVKIVAGAVEAIVRLFSGDLQGAWDAVKKIGDGILDVFKGLYKATIGVVVDLVEGIIDWCVHMWDVLVGHSIIPDMVEAIIDWFWKLPTQVGEAIKKFVNDVITKVKDMWNNIKNWFTSNVAPKFTTAYWNTKFDTIRQSITDKLNAAKTTVQNTWESIKSWFSSNVAPKFTKSYWTTKFDTIRQGATEKLNAAKTSIQNVWSTISNWFKTSVAPKFTVSFWTNKFNVIKDGAKSAFNGLISIVERAINYIINKLNTISISIPSWVPGIGGSYFGIHLNPVSIPRLAEGGIVTSSTLANIGERGKEAVLPLENNTQWMDALADRIAARNSTPSKIVLKVGERELGWATIDSINGITKQTGGLQLQLA